MTLKKDVVITLSPQGTAPDVKIHQGENMGDVFRAIEELYFSLRQHNYVYRLVTE